VATGTVERSQDSDNRMSGEESRREEFEEFKEFGEFGEFQELQEFRSSGVTAYAVARGVG
jgi:hypothetical protein